MARAAYYAVARGRRPGVYATWDECQKEVTGYPAASFKKFDRVEEAERFAGVKSYLPTPGTAGGWAPQKRKPPAAGSSTAGSSKGAAGPSRGASRGHLAKLEGGKILPAEEGPDGFCRTADGRLVVYTDGGCLGNGKKGARAGLGVYWGARSLRNLSEPVPGPVQTNNRGELLAILRALETAPEPHGPLEIRTDSKYCIDCMNTWLPGWRRKNFKNSNGVDVLNLDLILHIERLLIARAVGAPSLDMIALRDVTREPEIGDVHFLWVKGHAGEDGNTMADKLATAGCSRPPPRDVPLYGVEEQLYLHGKRAGARLKTTKAAAPPAPAVAFTSKAAKKLSQQEADPASGGTMSTYFKTPAPWLDATSGQDVPPPSSSSKASAAVPAKRKRPDDKHVSSHSEADDIDDDDDELQMTSSQIRSTSMRVVSDDDEIQVIEAPPLRKKARQTAPVADDDDDEFDALDDSWLHEVGLDDQQK